MPSSSVSQSALRRQTGSVRAGMQTAQHPQQHGGNRQKGPVNQRGLGSTNAAISSPAKEGSAEPAVTSPAQELDDADIGCRWPASACVSGIRGHRLSTNTCWGRLMSIVRHQLDDGGSAGSHAVGGEDADLSQQCVQGAALAAASVALQRRNSSHYRTSWPPVTMGQL